MTDADRLSESADRVLLLTPHNAKASSLQRGVAAGGGLLPHASSLETPATSRRNGGCSTSR